MMELNADFSRRAVVHAGALEWVPSPSPGVDRRMLDRLGEEVARATSIVRYAPHSRFPAHVHDGGEEFLVLSGVFEDEHGAYPAGTYVRNPPRSSHTPGTGPGCTIFVKLWQFDLADTVHVVLDATHGHEPVPGRPGVEALAVHSDERETVRTEHWAPGAEVTLEHHEGLEALVLEGGFVEGEERFVEQSWLRLPPDAPLRAVAGPEGARVWTKTGHLARPQQRPAS